LDISKATFSGDYLQQLQQQSQQALQSTAQAGQQAVSSATSIAWKVGISLGVLLLVALGIIIYDVYATANCMQSIFLPPEASCKEPFTTQSTTKPTEKKPSLKLGPPSLLTKVTSTVTGSDSSGNLISSTHDATTPMTIPASSAPLSNQTQGAYSMQWWMFVNDWNYGYGKEKIVLQRPDPTNTSIFNPTVSLHPTDNTLKITVSVFPDGEGSSKTTPAPATGSSSSTDDVYVCEVSNIPLQSWLSVGMSVFGRNLDVYIDGKLVKSCFLSGVPKPATGDISVTPDGGFSGYMCTMYTYPRMLTPTDALNFFSSGTPCRNVTGTSTAANLTGYSVRFGVFNPQGKEVQEYTF
jgi:hypothetical protein